MMSEWNEYNQVEFDGLAINPGFSIYLFEIIKGSSRYFYIGMTGDPYYPSARSVLHRLAGHIDLRNNNTQSQFLNALEKEIFNKDGLTKEDLKTIKVKFHYWLIPGFVKWEGSMKEIDTDTVEYKEYKKIQSKVHKLEKYLIHQFKDKVLNKTNGDANSKLEAGYEPIVNQIKSIIEA